MRSGSVHSFALDLSALALWVAKWNVANQNKNCTDQGPVQLLADRLNAMTNDEAQNDLNHSDPWDATADTLPGVVSAGRAVLRLYGVKATLLTRISAS
jgi:hypothetical protein